MVIGDWGHADEAFAKVGEAVQYIHVDHSTPIFGAFVIHMQYKLCLYNVARKLRCVSATARP